MEIKEEFNSKQVRKELKNIFDNTYFSIIDELHLEPDERAAIQRRLNVARERILEEFDILSYSDEHYEDKELYPAIIVKEQNIEDVCHPICTSPSNSLHGNTTIEINEIKPILKIDDKGTVYIRVSHTDGSDEYIKLSDVFPSTLSSEVCVAK